MDKPKLQAFSNRYVAELINAAPPDDEALSIEGFSQEEIATVYRVLNQIRQRLLTEAQVLESL